MEDNYSFISNSVSLSNIDSYSIKLSLIEEQKVCEVAEIARCASSFVKEKLGEGFDFYESLCVLGDTLTLRNAAADFSTSEAIEHLSAFSKFSTLFDRTVFCRLFLEYLENTDIFVSEKDFFRSNAEAESFVYVKNAFSDEAYDVFSQDFDDPRVRYASNFKDALKLIADGIVTFCLLPFEERGVRIPTVEELVFRGDFKINSVIPVFGYDGNAEMKYALVSKNIYLSDFSEDDDRYFEIRVAVDSDVGLSSAIICAEEFGVKIHRVNTLNLKSENGENTYFSIVLKSTGKDFTKILIFLTLFLPDYIPVGIYKNIE